MFMALPVVQAQQKSLAILLVKISFNPTPDTRYITAATSLTIATNIFVTSIITYRLLHARRRLSKVCPSQDMQHYTGVVAILIESAAPLTIFGIPTAILDTVGRRGATNHREKYIIAYMTLSSLFVAFCVSASKFLPISKDTFESPSFFPEPFATYDHFPGDDRSVLDQVSASSGRRERQLHSVRSLDY